MPDRENKDLTHFVVDCAGPISIVSFFPYEWNSGLVAIGTQKQISVGICRFEVETSDVNGFEYNKLREFKISDETERVIAFSWSPETSLNTIPKMLRFCAAGGDYKVRVITSDMKDTNDDHELVLGHHSNYVNDVAFEPDKGKHIASVSDDLTCQIWSMPIDHDDEPSRIACFRLLTPGMTVRWHPKDPRLIMVAEKNGSIMFYNLDNQQPIMSLDCGQSPLASADWCPTDIIHAVAYCSSEVFFFDTSRSSQAIEVRQLEAEMGQVVAWCKSHSHVVACVGSPKAKVRVICTRNNQTLFMEDKAFVSDISWHPLLPVLAFGSDTKLHLRLLRAEIDK